MSFRDEIAADIENVFLMEEEFATLHRIEGVEIVCVVGSDTRAPKSDGAMYDLAQMDYLIFAKTSDLPPRKAVGSLLNLDGKELTVGQWDEEDGITIIGLYSPESA